MTEKHKINTAGEKDTGRVDAFSDGVFAIAVTLLILEIKVPELHGTGVNDSALWHALGAAWPSFVAFLGSFGVILTMWINHHGFFKLIHAVTPRVLYANGFLLLMITFVPFPTAVLAHYLNIPDAARAAAAFYCGTFVVTNLAYNVLYFAVAASPSAFKPGVSKAHRHRVRNAYLLAAPVYLAATLLSFVNAYAGLILSSSLWILWGFLSYAAPTTQE